MWQIGRKLKWLFQQEWSTGKLDIFMGNFLDVLDFGRLIKMCTVQILQDAHKFGSKVLYYVDFLKSNLRC